MICCKLGCLLEKEKAGPNERPGFSCKIELPACRSIPPLDYLLLPTEAGAGACFWAHAPRVRVAAARATTAAILVMVMIYFASFLCWLLVNNLVAASLWTKKIPQKNDILPSGGGLQALISKGVPSSTRSNNSIIWLFRRRIHPWLAGVPMSSS